MQPLFPDEVPRGGSRLGRVLRDRNNNQPPSPGVYPDYAAPVILKDAEGEREMRDLRWGMPSSKKALFDGWR